MIWEKTIHTSLFVANGQVEVLSIETLIVGLFRNALTLFRKQSEDIQTAKLQKLKATPVDIPSAMCPKMLRERSSGMVIVTEPVVHSFM